jgi:hypothetical protein
MRNRRISPSVSILTIEAGGRYSGEDVRPSAIAASASGRIQNTDRYPASGRHMEGYKLFKYKIVFCPVIKI